MAPVTEQGGQDQESPNRDSAIWKICLFTVCIDLVISALSHLVPILLSFLPPYRRGSWCLLLSDTSGDGGSVWLMLLPVVSARGTLMLPLLFHEHGCECVSPRLLVGGRGVGGRGPRGWTCCFYKTLLKTLSTGY